ncbi:MAG: hypothetical protein Q9199_005121 [Rusavskia elegans]
MQRLLVGQDWNHPVSRAELCDDTIAILEAWAAVPLVPGTKEYRFARARMNRDIIYEKLAAFNRPQPQRSSALPLMHQLLPAEPTLAVLNLTKGEISVAYRWIYQTGSREFAKYRAYRQPISYPVLARDGVTTLPARFSQDNDHLYGASRAAPFPPMRAPLAPLPVNKSVTSNERFHPYARPRTMANPLSPPTVKEPPLALLVEDPSVPTPVEDPSFQTLVMDKVPSETSPSNEMTLDELIQEAKDQQAIIGYTEAVNRGLLRSKGRRVQGANCPPENCEPEREPEDEMLRVPQPTLFEPEQAAEDMVLLVPRPGPVEPEQAAEDMVLQVPRPRPVHPAQAALEAMLQIPQVQLRGGFPSVVSCDSEQFEHLRYLDRS